MFCRARAERRTQWVRCGWSRRYWTFHGWDSPCSDSRLTKQTGLTSVTCSSKLGPLSGILPVSWAVDILPHVLYSTCTPHYIRWRCYAIWTMAARRSENFDVRVKIGCLWWGSTPTRDKISLNKLYLGRLSLITQVHCNHISSHRARNVKPCLSLNF